MSINDLHCRTSGNSKMKSTSCVDNADNALKRISQLRRFYRIHFRIPKSCLIPVAEAIDRTITLASNTDRINLVCFPILALDVPISPNTAGSSLSSVIHANLRRLTQSPFDPSTLCQQLPCPKSRKESSSSENLRTHINCKIFLSDVKAAIRVVASDDNVLEVSSEVLQALILRHKSEQEDSVTPIIPADNIAVTADEKKTIRSHRSFSGGCCGGIDGLHPAHLLDLVAVSTAEAGLLLCRCITNLTNKSRAETLVLLARFINRQIKVFRGFCRRCQCGRLRRAVQQVVGVMRRMTTVVTMVARCRDDSLHVQTMDTARRRLRQRRETPCFIESHRFDDYRRRHPINSGRQCVSPFSG